MIKDKNQTMEDYFRLLTHHVTAWSPVEDWWGWSTPLKERCEESLADSTCNKSQIQSWVKKEVTHSEIAHIHKLNNKRKA